MKATRVKVCGLTQLADVLLAAELGADATGFIFWKGSKRYCPPGRVAKLVAALPPFVEAVGVFVNETPDTVEHIASLAGLTAVQLHGPWRAADWKLFPLPIIRAVPATSRAELRAARPGPAQAFIVDTPSAGHGGTGRSFDWSMLRGIAFRRPLILAGGLNASNVAAAIRAVRPYAVDVASGVEASPGKKDAKALTRFFAAVQEA